MAVQIWQPSLGKILRPCLTRQQYNRILALCQCTWVNPGVVTQQRKPYNNKLLSPYKHLAVQWRGHQAPYREDSPKENQTAMHDCHWRHVTVDTTKTTVTVEWGDESKSRFHSIWLRHNCHCSECRQPFSGQKLIDPTIVSPEVKVKRINSEFEDPSFLQVTWNDGHVGEIPFDFLRVLCYTTHKNHMHSADRKPRLHQGPPPEIEYEELYKTREGVLKWLRQINDSGLSLVRGVPTEDGMVAKTAELIAHVQETIYGKVFDVLSTELPINVAYSDVHLGFHMDLIYYESPPGLQFLHCLKFDDVVEGGESLFVNVFQIAEEFRQKYPEKFEVLTRVPAKFKKVHYSRNFPVHMLSQKPHFLLNHKKQLVSVNWAPAFEGALAVEEKDVESYYDAYHSFADAIKSSPNIIEFRLKPGDLIVFNNRTMLHARRAFSSHGGVRHLQGCYVNIDEYVSRLRVLSNLSGDQRPIKRVGTQDWL